MAIAELVPDSFFEDLDEETTVCALDYKLKGTREPCVDSPISVPDCFFEDSDEELETTECSCALDCEPYVGSAIMERADISAKDLDLSHIPRDRLVLSDPILQFCVSVHDRTNLTNAENLVYLQNSTKDNTAKCTIKGLTKSGEHYEEAVKCLKSRCDRPRLIHQNHVRRILDAPTLKDGSGKELRILHDVVLQHLRALKAMGHEPSNSFVTSLLELKLDANTMFEWQWHSQKHTDVPDYQELLEFLDLRAQAAEASFSERKPPRGGFHSHSNGPRVNKPVPSFASNALPVDTSCIACKGDKNSCSKFRSLSHPDKIALLKSSNHCLNCLRPGHFVKACKSLHECKRVFRI